MFLVDDILTAPVKGIFNVFKAIHDQVEDELYNPDKLKEDLMKLQLQLELDQITEEEYDELEADILQRMSEGRKRGIGSNG